MIEYFSVRATMQEVVRHGRMTSTSTTTTTTTATTTITTTGGSGCKPRADA